MKGYLFFKINISFIMHTMEEYYEFNASFNEPYGLYCSGIRRPV
jgi:hypothetical protein